MPASKKQQQDTTFTAEFELSDNLATPTGPAGDFVTRRGKLFEAGDFPDKQFAITAEEMAAAVADFQPVPLDLEHRSTVLDGNLGRLESVELIGSELYGSVALPKWLDSLLDEGKRKVSCTWDRATKRLQGLALVNNPRISDAVLMAAFTGTPIALEDASSSSFAKGGEPGDLTDLKGPAFDEAFLQGMIVHHQMAVDMAGLIEGATKRPELIRLGQGIIKAQSGEIVQMTGWLKDWFGKTPSHSIGMQVMDQSMSGSMSAKAKMSVAAQEADQASDFAGARNSASDKATLQKIHDHCAQLGAECQSNSGASSASSLGGGYTFSTTSNQQQQHQLKEQVSPMSEPTAKEESKTVDVNAALKAEFANMQSEMAELKAANEALKAAGRRKDAEAFAEGLLKAGKATTAETALIVAAFEQALRDDEANPATVAFAGGEGEGEAAITRAAALRAMYAARPASPLRAEGQPIELSAGQVLAAFGGNSSDKASAEERIRKLMEITPLGRATLADNGKK